MVRDVERRAQNTKEIRTPVQNAQNSPKGRDEPRETDKKKNRSEISKLAFL